MGLVHSVVQSVLDGTSISLGNTTMWPCQTQNAELLNAMEIDVPPGIPTLGLVGVHLDSFNMSMTSTLCDRFNCTTTPLGYFPTQESWLGLGSNKVKWDVGASLFDSGSLLNQFIEPLFFENKTVALKLKSEDVSLWLRFTVLPSYTFKKLTLEKVLTCKSIGITQDTKEVDDKFCHGDDPSYKTQGFSIQCVPSTTIVTSSDANTVVV